MTMAAAYLSGPPAAPGTTRTNWSCDGKAAFESAVIAVEAANRSRAKGPRSIYRCDACGRFHVSGTKTRLFETAPKANKH